MRHELYFDINRDRYFKESDFTLYSKTLQDSTEPFIHHLGFPIFLSPAQLDYDEYAINDPYHVCENLDGDFQQRRILLTKELICRIATHESEILDLGCGEGYISNSISKDFHNICGLDFSLSAIETAKTRFPDLEFCVADALSPPFSSKYFDVVVCNNLFEHVDAPVILLRQINRVLKDNGFLIISTPSRYRTGNLLRAIIGKSIKFISKYHITEYTVGQIIEMLNYVGFNVIDITSRNIIQTGFRKLFINGLLYNCIQILIRIFRSHHRLEGTVFFLAQKRSPI